MRTITSINLNGTARKIEKYEPKIIMPTIKSWKFGIKIVSTKPVTAITAPKTMPEIAEIEHKRIMATNCWHN